MSLETKAVAIGGASVAGYGLAAELAGVPVGVVLASFLGAAFILSFLPAMSVRKMFGTVIFCTTAAISGAPLISRKFDFLTGGEMFVALVIAAGLQIFLPWAIDNRSRIMERWFPSTKRGGE